MPAENDFVRITAFGMLQGATNPVINVWDYQIVQMAGGPLGLLTIGPAVAEAFVARYYTALQNVISTTYTLTGLSMRTYGKPFDGWDGADPYMQGTVATPAMPPFVTYSVMRLRTNFVFKKPGRKSYAGVPVSAIAADGTVVSSVRDLFNTVFNAWETTPFFIEADEADMVWADRVIQNADLRVVPTVTAAVAGYQLQGFGSQNGRKG